MFVGAMTAKTKPLGFGSLCELAMKTVTNTSKHSETSVEKAIRMTEGKTFRFMCDTLR